MTFFPFDVWEHGKPFAKRHKWVEAHDENHAAEMVVADLVADDPEQTRYVWVVPSKKDECAAKLLRVTGEVRVVYEVEEAHTHACADCKVVEGCDCLDPEDEHHCAACRERRYCDAQAAREGASGG